MPKELKELLGDKLKQRAKEIEDPDFVDKIGDETVATSSDDLVKFLEKAKHPALEMEPLI
jgi:acetyl-CoA synthase